MTEKDKQALDRISTLLAEAKKNYTAFTGSVEFVIILPTNFMPGLNLFKGVPVEHSADNSYGVLVRNKEN